MGCSRPRLDESRLVRTVPTRRMPLDANPPDTGVYRIWYERQNSTVAYIGESSNIPSRLYNHEQAFGEDALFAYAEQSDLDASHKREEIDDRPHRGILKVGEAPLAGSGVRWINCGFGGTRSANKRSIGRRSVGASVYGCRV